MRAQECEADDGGSRAGVGLKIYSNVINGKHIVRNMLRHSPAERCGLQIERESEREGRRASARASERERDGERRRKTDRQIDSELIARNMLQHSPAETDVGLGFRVTRRGLGFRL